MHARHTWALLSGAVLDTEPVDLYAAWTAVLDAASQSPPVWVVEDVHLAGPDLLAFLRHALDNPRTGGRLVVLTGRPTAGLAEAFAAVTEVPVLHLQTLSGPVTRELVHELVGDAVPPEYLEGIVRSSGGNPLFVEELLRSWIVTGVLRVTDQTWVFAGGRTHPTVPSTVQGIYQGQLDALAPPARSVVERGSVPGITFPVNALPALGVAEPREPLDALTRAGLLTGPHDDTVSREAYTYRHALLRDTAYGSLARHDRAELHVRFARWLQQEVGPGTRGLADLVASHLATAAEVLSAIIPALDDGTPATDLADEAATWLERAAEEHLVSSPQRAAEVARRALDLPRASGGADRLRRRLLLAEAERRSGRLETSMTEFAAAGEGARAREDSRALVTAALGYEDALFASRLPREVWGGQSLSLLRAAETTLPPDAAVERSTVLSALGRALAYGGDEAAGTAACQQAVDLAQGDPTALVRALLALRSVQSHPALLPQRLEAGEQIASVAHLTTDPELELEAARLRLIDQLEAGDLAAMEQAQAEATRLVEHLARPLYFWYPPMWRSMRALLAGRYESASALIEEFTAAGHRSHYRDVELVRLIQRLRLLLDTAGVEAVLPALEERAAQDRVRWSFGPALVRAHLGDVSGARRHLDVYAARGFENVVRDLSWAATMAHLADAVTLLDDASAAATIAALMTPWAGHVVVIGSGALCLGSASHSIGTCLRVAGDLAGARRHLEDAARANDRLGAPGFAARSRAELARVVRDLGDVDAARDLRRSAWTTATALGMQELAATTREDGS